MKLFRILFIALAFAGLFFYFTTLRSQVASHVSSVAALLGQPSHVEISEASSGSDTGDAEEQNNISVYRRNINSVVNITSHAVEFNFFYGLVPQDGAGSGFIIDKDGHILTNYHVIADARQIEVTLHNRKKYRATIVGSDQSHDLAVIQIKAPDQKCMPLAIRSDLRER
jgi:S1-C subfamily serine protease